LNQFVADGELELNVLKALRARKEMFFVGFAFETVELAGYVFGGEVRVFDPLAVHSALALLM
jgi:hypothetical protein